MSDEKPSPGPWSHRLEIGTRIFRDADGKAFLVGANRCSQATAAIVADAWQLPQLREDNRAMLELLREVGGMRCECNPNHFASGRCPHERARALLDKHGRG